MKNIKEMKKRNKTGGREKGTPNKLTSEIRDVYKELLEKNLNNIDVWLKETSKDHPDKALNFIIKLSEFVVPKLQSTHLTGNSKTPIITGITFEKRL